MTDTATIEHDDHAAHAGHPVDRHYVNIAIALALITGIEIAVSYIDAIPVVPEIVALMILMGIKFSVVASQFMHLKFDNRILSRIFYTGLFLAVFVYVIALTTFRIWNF